MESAKGTVIDAVPRRYRRAVKRQGPPFALFLFAACEALALGATVSAGDPTLNSPELWILAALAWPVLLFRRSRVAWYLAVAFTTFWTAVSVFGVSVLGVEPGFGVIVFALGFAGGLAALLTPGMRGWVMERRGPTGSSSSAVGLASR